jgi:DNA-binding transcriptional MerR regulator
MENFFKIGEMAEMFDISIRALHLYDKMGLFKPEYIDEGSGYRYYAPEQVHKLNTILSLKKVGFSLAEIKRLFEKNLDRAFLLGALRKKAVHFQQQVEIATYNIENIEHMIHAVEDPVNAHTGGKLTDQEKAYKMSRLVCLENYKVDNLLSEILWL